MSWLGRRDTGAALLRPRSPDGLSLHVSRCLLPPLKTIPIIGFAAISGAYAGRRKNYWTPGPRRKRLVLPQGGESAGVEPDRIRLVDDDDRRDGDVPRGRRGR